MTLYSLISGCGAVACLRSNKAVPLLLLVLLLAGTVSPTGAAHPTVLELRDELSDASGNTIRAVLAPSCALRVVYFDVAPCSGISAHHHTSPELLQVVHGTLQLGLINQTNALTTTTIASGRMVEIPAGAVGAVWSLGAHHVEQRT